MCGTLSGKPRETGPCRDLVGTLSGPCRDLVTAFPCKSQEKPGTLSGPCRDLVWENHGKRDLVGTLLGPCRDIVTVSLCGSQGKLGPCRSLVVGKLEACRDIVGTLLGPCHAILLGPVGTLSPNRRESWDFVGTLSEPCRVFYRPKSLKNPEACRDLVGALGPCHGFSPVNRPMNFSASEPWQPPLQAVRRVCQQRLLVGPGLGVRFRKVLGTHCRFPQSRLHARAWLRTH